MKSDKIGKLKSQKNERIFLIKVNQGSILAPLDG